MEDCTPKAEVQITPELVERLINAQVTSLIDITGESDPTLGFFSSGWDNEIYRLGKSSAVRLPRRQVGANLILSEQRWLPAIAKRLSTPVPVPKFIGAPSGEYPWTWSIVPWFDGTSLATADSVDAVSLMEALAEFLNCLHITAPTGAPKRTNRGVPLFQRDETTREYISLRPADERVRLFEVWDHAVNSPVWNGPDLWLHGDLHPLNVLVDDGSLSAVIDFGDMTSGDPAVDFAIAWMAFEESERQAFRDLLVLDGHGVDDATWDRARGWALSMAVAIVAHTSDDPLLNQIGLETIGRALAS